ncbi:Spo0E like sporulation regulatory protein [Anaerobacterium chartisolvens]|uniref:Spo0E like sporulation regulatory protein n=1 Tax=Anaerobacterium chartisolvens TaxID=1297424 RepID=A0A369AME0_9FIRM|nr:aspartyl-phosphate phosphatase Spo0E family protein [Anaerobacterium chartisolvens]RCX10341.1 Spo0E like sporulation regulatory protein [Anaerobacterium chartisolvens]
MTDEKKKLKIDNLQSLLNSLAIPENLQSENILNISRELDILIAEYYLNPAQRQQKTIYII